MNAGLKSRTKNEKKLFKNKRSSLSMFSLSLSSSLSSLLSLSSLSLSLLSLCRCVVVSLLIYVVASAYSGDHAVLVIVDVPADAAVGNFLLFFLEKHVKIC